MKVKKLLALILAACMVLTVVAGCGDTTNQPSDGGDGGANNGGEVNNDGDEVDNDGGEVVEPTYVDKYAEMSHAEASEALYDAVLGGFYEYYQLAKDPSISTSEKFALSAIAEAKLLEQGVLLPSTANGGNYTISRVIPRTVTTTYWGTDMYRYHNALVIDGDPLTAAERTELTALWNELRGTGTYEQAAKDWAADKGYTFTDTYTLGYVSDPVTWDAHNTYLSADHEAIVNTVDGLLEYNCENVQVPALATSYEVSEDGLTYTFHIREGVNWVNQQGVIIEPLTADSFVAGFQHLLDAQGGTEYLVDGIVKNATEYMEGTCGFEEVGCVAVDDYTLVYTLENPTSYFITMLSYNCFQPLSRSFFLAQGGAFGLDAYAEASASESYTYGLTPENIAYCGPYLVTSYTASNSIVFDANPEYWNKDNINIKKITWRFIDGQNPTESYDLMMEGVFAGAGLGTQATQKAKEDGMFDTYAYVSSLDASSFPVFLNVYRKQYENFNDATVAISELSENDRNKSNLAMQNQHFRLAICFALDRGAFNATTTGDDLKYNSLVNSYCPGDFVYLSEEVTVDINGTATTFPAGTYYGQIMQAQLDADGCPITVWNPEANDGIGGSIGYDGWYNPDEAKAQLELAIEELSASDGMIIDAEHPVYLDLPYCDINETYSNRANALKQSIEASLEGKVIINLVKTGGSNALNWYNAAYYPATGDQMNFHLSDVSGWGPDYGDPFTYLDTMLPQGGGMAKNLGLF